MEEKLFVRRDDIQIGMQLGESVKDIRGRAMIENGVYLDAYQVRYIKEQFRFRRLLRKLSVSIENRIVLKFSFPWK